MRLASPVTLLAKTRGQGHKLETTHVALRLVLYAGEVYSLARSCPGIRIIDGEAWISFDATDTIACRGDEIRLRPGRDFAVVATVGRSALVMEVLASGSPSRGWLAQRQRSRATVCEGA